MQAVYMKYHRSGSVRPSRDSAPGLVHQSPLVRLSSVNQYSETPCPKGGETVEMYSKGKLSGMPRVGWDDEAGV